MTSCLLITTFNRTPLLRSSLERASILTLPDEILVVDDGGSDGCQEMCAALPLPNVRYVYNHNPTPSICSLARNIGIRNTDADIVITSEPEVMFITDVIAQFLAQHEEHPMDVISAGTVHHAQSEGQLDPGQCETVFGWVASFTALYEREWLLEVGGWDESLPGSWGWDDTDLLTRLRIAGHGQVIHRPAEILHQWHPPNRDNQSVNERHFMAKAFHRGDLETDLVANKGVEWGAIRKP